MFVDDRVQTVPGTVPEVSYLLQSAPAVPVSLTWLSPTETAFLQTLGIEKRRQDWLLGRWTAKMLVSDAIANKTGIVTDPAAITIHKDADGAPSVGIAAMDSLDLTISLSHSHGIGAAAIVSSPDWPLGIDVEKLEPRHPAFVGDYFTDSEQEQLQGIERDRYMTAVTAIWSGKEAALKAVRQGLTQDTRVVNCAPDFSSDPTEQWLPFSLSWDPSRIACQPTDLTGWWRTFHDFVLTIAIGATP